MEIVKKCQDIETISVDKGNSSKTFVEARTQTSLDNYSSKTMNTKTHKAEFQYRFSSTKDYLETADDEVRFYTGLPNYDILLATFNFVFPYVTRKTSTISFFPRVLHSTD